MERMMENEGSNREEGSSSGRWSEEGSSEREAERKASEQYRQVSDIVGHALDLPVAERAEAIGQACGDDRELLAEVESMVAIAGEDTAPAGRFLVDPLLKRAGDDIGVGSEIGAFTLGETLGEGGMGMVFRAQRREGFEQQVAIKLIKPGMASREIVSRFEHERQILAGLEHPNIARLLDGGAREDDRPYFVMEYVEGAPIDEYCQRHELLLDARLALFSKVCRAVQFAHRRSVLHRDLKPANILVTPQGEPKLLDFGIAKLLGEDDGQATQLGTAGTPLYASPEQLNGRPLTTASDVYSLGVLLYILLCGKRHDEGVPTGPARARALEKHEPDPPSSQLDDPTRRRRLSGDLDAIVCKALRPEPEARYPSVDELLADLERHRDGYPVRAHKGNWTYRSAKMIRRHRARFLAAFAVLVLVAVSLVAVIERRQRARDAALIAATNNFIYEIFQAASPKEAGKVEPVVRNLLERGVQGIDEDLKKFPEAGAGFLSALGRTYRHLGDYDRAEDLLRDSLERRRQILPPMHLEIATSCNNLALVLREKGAYLEAEDLIREALAIYLELEGPDSLDVGKAYGNLGGIRRARGDRRDALEYYGHSLELKRLHFDPADRDFAVAQSNLGKAHEDLGELERAAGLYRTGLDKLNALKTEAEEGGRDTGGIDSSRATVLHNFGGVLRLKGDLPGATWMLRESLANRRESYPLHHRKIAEVERSLALLERDQERFDEAAALLATAHESLVASLGENHPEVAFTLHEMAVLAQRQGDDVVARELAGQALAIEEARLDPGHWRMEKTEALLAELGAQRSTTGR